MKRSVLLAVFLASLFAANAQKHVAPYTFGIGLRAGSQSSTCGVTFKGFVHRFTALEAQVGWANSAPAGTLMIQQHFPLMKYRLLHAYAGFGGHYTHRSGYSNYTDLRSGTTVYIDGGSAYGVDVIAGLEFTFPSFPVSISLDLKPMLEFNQQSSYEFLVDKSIGVKFVF
jgi:hypothetical protein